MRRKPIYPMNSSGAHEDINMSKAFNLLVKKKQKILTLRNEWYSLRPILGHFNWAIFALLIGGREAGKSYSVTNFFVDQFVNKGIPFTWIRLTERQAQKLLNNNAEKLVDPDIRRKYGLDLMTVGGNVYAVRREPKKITHKDGTVEIKMQIVEKKLMARVFALSTFYTDKGSIYDKDFLDDLSMRYNIAIDEFQREKGEKNTFDILYALVNQLENIVRSTKNRMKIFFMGNTLEESSDILCAFNFIPETFGIFKLKSKRAVIHNIEPTEAYKLRRKGSIADILMPTASTFTNKIEADTTLITKKRLKEPTNVIKFTKNRINWFTVWDGNIIRKYMNEKKEVIAMRPYLDEIYNVELVRNMITLFDSRSLLFQNMITFKQFQKEIELLSPRR